MQVKDADRPDADTGDNIRSYNEDLAVFSSADKETIQQMQQTSSATVQMSMQMQQHMAAQSAQMNQMQEKMDAMRAKRSGGRCGGGRGGGGRDDGAKNLKTQENNTASTLGWAQWSNDDRSHWRKRERCNLGAYCWSHGFDPMGFNYTSKSCGRRKEGHNEHATKYK